MPGESVRSNHSVPRLSLFMPRRGWSASSFASSSRAGDLLVRPASESAARGQVEGSLDLGSTPAASANRENPSQSGLNRQTQSAGVVGGQRSTTKLTRQRGGLLKQSLTLQPIQNNRSRRTPTPSLRPLQTRIDATSIARGASRVPSSGAHWHEPCRAARTSSPPCRSANIKTGRGHRWGH